MILLRKFINSDATESDAFKILNKISSFDEFNDINLKKIEIIKNKYIMRHVCHFYCSKSIIKYTYFFSGNDSIIIYDDDDDGIDNVALCHFQYAGAGLVYDRNSIKKYYRLFYDMTREDFKKRKDVLYQQVVWPVYKLPITIQNPYV